METPGKGGALPESESEESAWTPPACQVMLRIFRGLLLPVKLVRRLDLAGSALASAVDRLGAATCGDRRAGALARTGSKTGCCRCDSDLPTRTRVSSQLQWGLSTGMLQL